MPNFVSIILAFGLMTVAFGARAQTNRSIVIAAPEGRIELINGSDQTVNYNVECFDSQTGANLIVGGTNLSLLPKKSSKHSSNVSCASGTAIYTHSSGVVACQGSANFAAAPALCGSDAQLCTFAALRARSVTNIEPFPDYYWIDPTADFYYTWDGGTKWQSVDFDAGKMEASYSYKSGANYGCNETQSTTGMISPCVSTMKSSNASGAICCPQNNGFKSCKVTILSTTPVGGSLQSPQFKGGSSF